MELIMVLSAKTVAESLKVDWLSKVPCVSISSTATWWRKSVSHHEARTQHRTEDPPDLLRYQVWIGLSVRDFNEKAAIRSHLKKKCLSNISIEKSENKEQFWCRYEEKALPGASTYEVT